MAGVSVATRCVTRTIFARSRAKEITPSVAPVMPVRAPTTASASVDAMNNPHVLRTSIKQRRSPPPRVVHPGFAAGRVYAWEVLGAQVWQGSHRVQPGNRQTRMAEARAGCQRVPPGACPRTRPVSRGRRRGPTAAQLLL